MPKENSHTIRKRLSGAEYRKKRAEKEAKLKRQSGSLTKFLKVNSDCSSVCENITSTSVSDTEPSTSGCRETSFESEIHNECGDELAEEIQLSEDAEASNFSDAGIISEVPSDPANWTEINENMRILIVKKGPLHYCEKDNARGEFPKDSHGRRFKESYYQRRLCNGEVIPRKWLVYSEIKDAVFCFCCKLFSSKQNNSFTSGGYNDWTHIGESLSSHENSKAHLIFHQQWNELALRLRTNKTIDACNQRMLDEETKHWKNVLERLLAIVHFLAQQCLPFRGTSDKLFVHDNGNFLKLVELISKFDTVMSEHLLRIKDGSTRQHYLGKDTQNEIIHLLANKIKQNILTMVRDCKYYSIIVDCTPDISHIEQTTIIIRCVKIAESSVEVREHFLGFIPVTSTTGAALTQVILDHLEKNGLLIENLRGQGYDNGSNMKGKHSGVQKRITEINPRAFFVPCSCHSLNLVVNDAAKSSREATSCFDIIQKLYVFFSASTMRWDVLKAHIPSLTVKPLCTTRWGSRVDAVRPIRYQIGEIYDALFELSTNESIDRMARHEAECLASSISDFKFLCCLVTWHNVLNHINVASKLLQKVDMDLSTAINELKGVLHYLE